MTSLATLSASESLVARAADLIRDAILSGEIAAGDRLSVPELSRRLGISRTPAREALLVLERDGIVESRPRLGVVVVTGDEHDIRALFQLREALDGMAARLAATQLSEDGRARLRPLLQRHEAAIDAQDVEAHIACDLEFHGILRDGNDNGYLASALLGLERRLTVLMRTFSHAPRAMGPGVLRDHRAIMDAVLTMDADAAEAAARRHVRNVALFFTASLKEGSGPSADNP
ncbi:GntR family transcriptional regulator [Tropicimonas isoalkanivorans]|uniref:DNA-binding transcriptional regulator, GntR family n=1 Tax=Tropicimonas isoalkanivorans TaxID=441112 RepID=A0A1I1I106_9RHOB|nr:GntR family transcriptional regulator [Tropicimonas isoalkanivorans]SFC29502.1 DNA-binding transcriptional regulator, GntR family [Tropicimonas isoalkanivorans]